MALLTPRSIRNEIRYLIVGLGNPGVKYQYNRHNVGFMTLNELGKLLGLAFSRFEHKSLVTKGEYYGKKIILAKPQTFMNNSGQSVSSLVRYYKVPLSNLLVVYDDIDLPFGSLRIRPKGGSSGHKGMASIINYLNSQDFPRLRVGIDRPPGQMDASTYVLQDFTKQELNLLEDILEFAADSILTYIDHGLEIAMTKSNPGVSP
ncbi:MAG: aminoacyl-tRNA hydrolase [Anaerolineales bacterium]|nr:aminoacyl-tRNA hydrolase [Anaerolineales bacterium]